MDEIKSYKFCPVCGKHIIGRTDKKFCSGKCKSMFHYEKQKINPAKQRSGVMGMHKKNRNIKLTSFILLVLKKCLFLK